MSIELATGQTVELASFYLERTYEGLLEGLPRAGDNARKLAQTAWRMLPLWIERRVHLIPPVTRQESGHPILPELTYYARLICHTPIDPWPGASELVVAWFGPERPEVSLSALVTEAVRDLPWASLAMDADY